MVVCLGIGQGKKTMPVFRLCIGQATMATMKVISCVWVKSKKAIKIFCLCMGQGKKGGDGVLCMGPEQIVITMFCRGVGAVGVSL